MNSEASHAGGAAARAAATANAAAATAAAVSAMGVSAVAVAAMGGAAAENALPQGVPLLFVDASAPLVQVGVWQDGAWLAHLCVDAPALEAIFHTVRTVLAQADVPLAGIGGFIHNEGPGSILGIRLGAMALRVWALGGQAGAGSTGSAGNAGSTGNAVAGLPVWAVRSLPLLATKVAACAGADSAAQNGTASSGAGTGAFAVVSEFRQGLWNWFQPSAQDAFGETIEVISTVELTARLEAGNLRCYYLRHRKSWASPPCAVIETDSDLSACPQVFLLPDLLRRVALPEAFLSRPPEFKTADGERHRGAAAAPANSAAASTASASASAAAAAQPSRGQDAS